jgi:hypothetical protein
VGRIGLAHEAYTGPSLGPISSRPIGAMPGQAIANDPIRVIRRLGLGLGLGSCQSDPGLRLAAAAGGSRSGCSVRVAARQLQPVDARPGLARPGPEHADTDLDSGPPARLVERRWTAAMHRLVTSIYEKAMKIEHHTIPQTTDAM